ncbi:MAG: acyltransferase [Deltaproteobacteria bacterium]|nr:acyltransferase [Deltaproteobacteria bacterium]
MKAAFIQFNPVFGEIEDNIKKALTLIERTGAEIIVLPELFNTGYLITSKEEAFDLSEPLPGGKTTEALSAMAREKNAHIVAGLIERQGENLFNSAVVIAPSGYLGKYRKIHLFNEEKLWFQPGDLGFHVFDIGICRIGVMVCFDWFFPESMRTLALKGADVICHSANLVLPFCQDAMITRCLENRVFAVTANRTGQENRNGKSCHYTGRSQITDPNARILYRAGAETDEIGIAEIDVNLSRDKNLNRYNHVFLDRREDFYH